MSDISVFNVIVKTFKSFLSLYWDRFELLERYNKSEEWAQTK